MVSKLPAAFGRLCVETLAPRFVKGLYVQPPSGGCVLKRTKREHSYTVVSQPPSGGCVLKLLAR